MKVDPHKISENSPYDNQEATGPWLDGLTIAEELLLLILDNDQGDIRTSLSTHSQDLVIAGAVLMDLTLSSRIDTDLQRLVLLDTEPTGDDLLDVVLTNIIAEKQERDTAYWLEHTAAYGNEIRQRAIQRLIQRGILVAENNGLIFFSRLVSRIHRYPVIGEKALEEVQVRIMRTIFSDDIPHPRDQIIISLADACDIFSSIITPEELTSVRQRIEQISKLDLVSREVTAAIRRIKPPVSAKKSPRPCEQVPLVSGWPLVGNAFDMSRDIGQFLADQYRNHGPVFRVRAFNRHFIVFAGPEATVFLTKHGNAYLRSYDFWRDFTYSTGAIHMVVGMDGPDHLRMRKLLTKSYSPKFIETRIDEFVNITRQVIAEWPFDEPISALQAMQYIITEQLGLTLTGVSAHGYLDDLHRFLQTKLNVHALYRWPRWAELLPRYRRAERRVHELFRTILKAHEANQLTGKSASIVDEALAMNRDDPQFFPETDYLMTFLGPYFVGLGTISSVCAFMLYSLLKHPSLLSQMREEVDALFERGMPTAKDLRALDVTHRIAMETMRLYPVVPVVARTASNSFEFGGFQIPAGQQILVALAAAHQQAEYFQNPESFDIARYHGRPPEHRQPGVYTPFGIGRHRCLASSFSEVQIALTMATIVREVDFAVQSSALHLKINHSPTSHPDASFRFKVSGRRLSS